MNDKLVLEHYGVPGMKWGHRKRQEEIAYRKKLTNILDAKTANKEDTKRFKYRNQPVAKRIVKTAASEAAQMVVRDALNAHLRGQKMGYNKIVVGKKAGSIVARTATTVALNDALAKSASKRYTDDGGRVPGTKDHFISKETAIVQSIKIARIANPYAKRAIGMKAASMRANRQANEDRFNRWGENVLAQKVSNVITLDPNDYKIH